MKLIVENPYRILGLPINATDREIKKRIANFNAFISIGKIPESQFYDFLWIGPLNRDKETLELASQELENPDSKLFHSLFWFSRIDPIDEMALDFLREDNTEKAIKFWEKSLKSYKITSKNYSYIKNLALINLINAFGKNGELNRDYLIDSLDNFGRLFDSELFWASYIALFKNKKLLTSINTDEISYNFFDAIIKSVGKTDGITYKELIEVINESEISEEIKDKIINKFTSKYIMNIENEIDKCEQRIENNKSEAWVAGNELYQGTFHDTTLIIEILGEDDIQVQMLCDNIATTLTNCCLDTYNNNTLDDELIKEIRHLLDIAESIAISESAIDKVIDNKKGFENAIESIDSNQILKELLDYFNTYKDKLESTSYYVYNHGLNFYNKIKDHIKYLKSSDLASNDQIELLIDACSGFIRDCAVGCFNRSEFNEAKLLMRSSLEIVQSQKMRSILKSDFDAMENALSRAKAQEKAANTARLWVVLIIVGIIIVIALISSITDSCKNNNYSESNKYSNKTNTKTKTNTENKKYSTNNKNTNNTEKNKNQYLEKEIVRLKTGATPYNNYFGKGVYNRNYSNQLTVSNESGRDAVVCLVSMRNDKTIRNVYIRKNKKYKMKNIPNGKYYLNVFFGNDWDKNKYINDGKVKGAFTLQTSFAKFDDSDNIMEMIQYKKGRRIYYSIHTMKLYVIETYGYSGFNYIGENEFFK